MNVRPIDLDADYAEVSTWWESHGFTVVPRVFLPKIGVMVLGDDGTRLCAGWVYMDSSSPVTWFEWVVTNPKNRPTVSMMALKAAIGAAKVAVNAVREEVPGSAAMLFTCRQLALARLFEKEGFERTDESVIHMMTVVHKPEHVEVAN